MTEKLRVLHYPQLPCEPFITDVKNLEEAKLLMVTLGAYDYFQYSENIKPDYSNMSVLERYYDGEWEDWFDEETGISDIQEYFEFLESESKEV